MYFYHYMDGPLMGQVDKAEEPMKNWGNPRPVLLPTDQGKMVPYFLDPKPYQVRGDWHYLLFTTKLNHGLEATLQSANFNAERSMRLLHNASVAVKKYMDKEKAAEEFVELVEEVTGDWLRHWAEEGS